jgi:hypothetical protein
MTVSIKKAIIGKAIERANDVASVPINFVVVVVVGEAVVVPFFLLK